MINSKTLFTKLLSRISLHADLSEKEAILYLILEHLFGLSRIDVVKGKQVDFDEIVFESILGRINGHEPIQYVLNEAYFYGRRFVVDPSVLIPRPETELLIDLAKEKVGLKNDCAIIDIGTGSGCIAITLSIELPFATVIATDVSAAALEIAKSNAASLNSIVDFHSHDILKHQLGFGLFDLMVSNPPYIAASERKVMNENVKDYEPDLALFVPDTDPLVFYKALASQSIQYLKNNGWLIVEINERFGNETQSILLTAGLNNVVIHKDLDGKDRLISGQKLRG